MSDMDILAAIDAAVGCQQCGGKLDESVSDDFCGQECQEDWAAQHAEPLTDYFEPWDRPWDFPGVGTEAAVSGRAQSVQAHRYARGGHLPLPSTVPGTAFIDRGNGWEEMGRLRDGFTISTERRGLTPTSWIIDETHTWASSRQLASVEFRLPRSTGDLHADWRALARAETAASTDAQRAACALRRTDLTQRHMKAWTEMTSVLAQGFTEFGERIRATWESMARSIEVNFPQRWICGVDSAQQVDHYMDQDVRERALHARRNRNTGPLARQRAPRRIDAPGGRR